MYDEVVDEERKILNLASKEYSKCIEKYLGAEDISVTASISNVTTSGTYSLDLRATKQVGSDSNFEIISLSVPDNRNMVLFPEKINGMYYKLDRPYDYPSSSSGEIWISESPDLIHWGNFRPVLHQGYKFWNTVKIGPTPAIKTDKGWLEIIHGVANTAGGTYYYIGAILLDLNEPWKVIGKTNSYVLKPELQNELHGNSDNTVFACGAIADYDKDQIRLYYGGCDESINLAVGSISELVEACLLGL